MKGIQLLWLCVMTSISLLTDGIKVSAQTQALDTLAPMEKIVWAKFKDLNLKYHTSFKIVKTTGYTKAQKTLLVEVNVPQLLQLTKGVDEKQLGWIVNLVVTHEFMHLLQFRFYNGPIQNYEAKILEAQADILTGVYMFSRAVDSTAARYNPELDNNRGGIYASSTFQQAYGVFYNIGTATFALADHPDRFQRVNSFVRGVMYGSEIILINRLRRNSMKRDSTSKFIPQLETLLKISIHKLDIPMDESLKGNSDCNCYDSLANFNTLMQWSYEQAKMITHGNPRNLADIVISQPETKLAKDTSRLFKKWVIANVGMDTVQFKFEWRLIKSESDTDFLLQDYYQFSKNKYHLVTIPPHKKITITDTIERLRSPFSQIMPPQNDALFYAEKKEMQKDDNATGLASLNHVSESSLPFANYLLLLTDALKRQDFSDVIANMGHYQYNASSGIVVYNGYIPPGFSITSRINRNIKKPEQSNVTIELTDDTAYNRVDSVYQAYSILLPSLAMIDSVHTQRRLAMDSIAWKVRQKYFQAPYEQRDKTITYVFNNCHIDLHLQQTSRDFLDEYGNDNNDNWTKKFFVSLRIYQDEDDIKALR